MARRTVSYEMVDEACRALIAKSERPTVIKIRNEIGTGSFTTIKNLFNEWENSESSSDARIDQLPAVIDIPDEFKEEADHLLRKIFSIAEKQTEHRINTILAERDEALARSDQEISQLTDFVQKVEEENTVFQDRIEGLDDDLALIKKENVVLTSKVEELTGQLDGYDDNIHVLSGEIIELEKQREVLSEKVLVLRSTVDENKRDHKSNIASISDGFEQRILSMKEDHASELNDLKAEIKEIKSSHSDELKTLKKDRLIELEFLKSDADKRIDELKDIHSKSVADIKEAQNKLVSSLQKTNDELSLKVAQLESDFSKLSDEKQQLEKESSSKKRAKS